MKWSLLILVIAGAIAALAFVLTGGSTPGDVMLRKEEVSLSALDKVPEGHLQALKTKRIFFGHQSVGRDMLAGIGEIAQERPAFALTVVHGDAAALGDGAGLAEVEVGANTDPESKIRDFDQHVRRPGARLDVAFLKLCYVDVTGETDAKKLFGTYREAMEKLAEDVPGTRLLHCTVPLTTIETGWKPRLKRMLGKTPWSDASNLARHQFNALMRAEYGAEGTLIDIAAAESALPDGSKVTWKTGDVDYEVLAACYTNDGGHLDEVGRRVVGAMFLRRLAEFAATL